MNGAYSNVQSALAQLFGHPKGAQSAENQDSGQPAASGSRSVQTPQKPHIQESEGQSSKPNEQREQEKVLNGRASDAFNPDPQRDHSPGGFVLEDTGQTEGAALQLPGHPTTSEEDFSLIVDADMFQYLQKHCRKEYQHILSQYGVDVVDMTNQGLTTLFLQVATGVGEDVWDQGSLKLAMKAISRLYEENETKICRDHLPKSILSLRGGQQRVMDTLSVRFPQLLLNEDELNIYIIGSSSDVSEAKRLLLLGPSKVRGKEEDVASLLTYPPNDSGSSTRAHERRVPHTLYSTADSQSDRMDQQKSEEDERRAEGTRKYKLAARFKDSGLPALGSRPTDFSLRGLSPPIRQTHQGPILGHDVLSDTAGIYDERVSRASAQNTGGDILFQSRDALPSKASTQNKTSSKAHSIDTRPKSLSLISPINPTESSSSGSTALPPVGSGAILKRTRSFSGTPLQKAQVVSQKSQDDSARPTVRERARSSSVSLQTRRDKREVYNAEITVSIAMWLHIKEAYSSRVDDLTSDVQMKESILEGSRNLIVTLRGANSSKVGLCQLGLQNLVDLVCIDFSVHKLRLSELGITDVADQALQACCTELQGRFKNVTVKILKKGLYLYGPNVLCSQLGATLREVLSREPAQIQDLSGPSTSKWTPDTLVQMNEDQSTSLRCHSNPQVMLESPTSKADGTDSSQERKTRQRSGFRETECVNRSVHQPLVRKNPVIKEKVKMLNSETDGHESFVSHTETGIDSASHVNDATSTTTPTGEDMALNKKERTIHSTHKDRVQRRRATQDPPEEPGPGGPGCICVCGESEMLMKTQCGASMCSNCLDTVHVHCRVCHETEATPRGITGKISCSKLNIAVPGHQHDSTIKITYCIPDGVQGVRGLFYTHSH